MFSLQLFNNYVRKAKPLLVNRDLKVISTALNAESLKDISSISFERLLDAAESICNESIKEDDLYLLSEINTIMQKIETIPPIQRQRIL